MNRSKLLLLVVLGIWYVACRLLCRRRSARDTFLFLFVCSGLAESVWGLLQLYGYLPSRHALFRITGSFLNPGPYAGYLAVVFPLALYDYLFRRGLRRWTGAAACLLILPLLPAAMSRASWLAALSGGAVVLYGRYACVLHAWVKSHVRWLRTMIAVSVLLLLLVP
ncbi:MAG: hypothetical protein LBM61_05065, partial [Prevotellaceae bacterium]|nr:hypothetical protein [Prevotellaceae bacterium]